MLPQIDCFSPVMFSLMKIIMSLPFHLMCPHIPYFPLFCHLLFPFHVHHQSLCLRTSLHHQHRKVTPPLPFFPQVISLSLNPLYLSYHPHATHHPLICSPLPPSTLLHQIHLLPLHHHPVFTPWSPDPCIIFLSRNNLIWSLNIPYLKPLNPLVSLKLFQTHSGIQPYPLNVQPCPQPYSTKSICSRYTIIPCSPHDH
jgi:hypothetical protein